VRIVASLRARSLRSVDDGSSRCCLRCGAVCVALRCCLRCCAVAVSSRSTTSAELESSSKATAQRRDTRARSSRVSTAVRHRVPVACQVRFWRTPAWCSLARVTASLAHSSVIFTHTLNALAAHSAFHCVGVTVTITIALRSFLTRGTPSHTRERSPGWLRSHSTFVPLCPRVTILIWLRFLRYITRSTRDTQDPLSTPGPLYASGTPSTRCLSGTHRSLGGSGSLRTLRVFTLFQISGRTHVYVSCSLSLARVGVPALRSWSLSTSASIHTPSQTSRRCGPPRHRQRFSAVSSSSPCQGGAASGVCGKGGYLPFLDPTRSFR